MTRAATVAIDITCPACFRKTLPPSGVIRFTWGMLPAKYRWSHTIRWLTGPNEFPLPSFKLIGPPRRLQYNFGDWRFANVIAFDSDLNRSRYFCRKCKQEFEAIAVSIVHGQITSGLAFLPGECVKKFGRSPRDLAVVEITPNGATIAHDEWIDPPLSPLSTSTDEPRESPGAFPALNGEEHAVVHIDPRTGRLLDEAGYFALNGNLHYYVFPTFAEAERFVDDWQREKPFSEWWVFDASERVVARRFALADPSPERAPVRTSTRAAIAGWIRSLLVRE